MCTGAEEDAKKAAEKVKGKYLYYYPKYCIHNHILTSDKIEDEATAQKKEELKFIYKVWSGYTR